MPHQVVWPKCNVYDAGGTATILRRGDMVPDGVDDAQLEMLSVVGAVRVVEYAPDDYRPPVPENESVEAPSDTGPLQKPSQSDSKEAWVAYASDERNPDRISRPDAESMSKAALVDRFK